MSAAWEQVNWKAAAFTAAALSAIIYAIVFAPVISGGPTSGHGRYLTTAVLCVVLPVIGWLAMRATSNDRFRTFAAGVALAPFPGAIVLVEAWLTA